MKNNISAMMFDICLETANLKVLQNLAHRLSLNLCEENDSPAINELAVLLDTLTQQTNSISDHLDMVVAAISENKREEE